MHLKAIRSDHLHVYLNVKVFWQRGSIPSLLFRYFAGLMMKYLVRIEMFCLKILLDGIRIGEEFRCGEEYWSLERKLCRALTSKEEVCVWSASFSLKLMWSLSITVSSILLCFLIVLEMFLEIDRHNGNEVSMHFYKYAKVDSDY